MKAIDPAQPRRKHRGISGERFEQTGVDARCVRGSFKKWIEDVRTFQFGEITDGLVLTAGVELVDYAEEHF